MSPWSRSRRIRSKTPAASFGDRPSEGSSSSSSRGSAWSPPGEGQHLRLAAAQARRRPIQLVREGGKQAAQIGPGAPPKHESAAMVGAHAEVLLHAQGPEDQAPLRHLDDAAGHDGVRGQAADRLPLEPDLAGGRRHDARDGIENRCLAGSVHADDGHDLPGPHLQGHPVDRAQAAVGDAEIAHFKHRTRRPCPSRPPGPSHARAPRPEVPPRSCGRSRARRAGCTRRRSAPSCAR